MTLNVPNSPVALRQKRAPSELQCKACNHPGLDELNEMLRTADDMRRRGEPANTYAEISEVLQIKYPEAPVLNADNISRHRHRHLNGGEVIAYVIKSGQLVRPDGRILDHVMIADALKTTITMGILQILNGGMRVKPQDMLKAVELLMDFAPDQKDKDEMLDEWLKIARSGRVSKTTRKAAKLIRLEEDAGGALAAIELPDLGYETESDESDDD